MARFDAGAPAVALGGGVVDAAGAGEVGGTDVVPGTAGVKEALAVMTTSTIRQRFQATSFLMPLSARKCRSSRRRS